MAKSTASGASPEFKSLLDAMPRIAEAVKAFPEAVQPQAFDALMAELRGVAPEREALASAEGTLRRSATPAAKKKAPASLAGSRQARGRSSGPALVKDLDLAPKGKKSFKAFVQEKRPQTQHDQNVLSVYYLSEIADQAAVTVDHVFTCYKDMHWREPSSIANSLAVTASRKRFLDTANLADIKLTPPGRNHAEHDLPAPTKK